jgi:hypothetical protein
VVGAVSPPRYSGDDSPDVREAIVDVVDALFGSRMSQGLGNTAVACDEWCPVPDR